MFFWHLNAVWIRVACCQIPICQSRYPCWKRTYHLKLDGCKMKCLLKFVPFSRDMLFKHVFGRFLVDFVYSLGSHHFRLQDLHAQLSGVPGSGFLAGGRGFLVWPVNLGPDKNAWRVGWLNFVRTQFLWEFELNFEALRLPVFVVKKGRWMMKDSIFVDNPILRWDYVLFLAWLEKMRLEDGFCMQLDGGGHQLSHSANGHIWNVCWL